MKFKGKQFVSCLLVVVSSVVSFFAGYVVGNYDKSVKRETVSNPLLEQESFFVESSDLNFGMKIRIADAVSTETGVTTTSSEDVKTVTASFTPTYAVQPTVIFSLAWKNAESEWATGKTVTDYVKIVDDDPSDLTANLECIKAFGELITLKCMVADNSAIYDTATLHYLQKINSFMFRAGTYMEAGPNGIICDIDTWFDLDAPDGCKLVTIDYDETQASDFNFIYSINNGLWSEEPEYEEVYTDPILEEIRITMTNDWKNEISACSDLYPNFSIFSGLTHQTVYKFDKLKRTFEFNASLTRGEMYSGYALPFSFCLSANDVLSKSYEELVSNYSMFFEILKNFDASLFDITVTCRNPFMDAVNIYILEVCIDTDSIVIPAQSVAVDTETIVF